MPIDIEALIRAHPYINIERPPEVWQPDSDDALFIRFFGELLAAILARNGGKLANVTVGISNVVVEPTTAGPIPQGEFVAITGFLAGDALREVARVPDGATLPPVVSRDLESAAAAAGAAWVYTRALTDQRNSVTVLFSRRA